MHAAVVMVGTAGWDVPKAAAGQFAEAGSILQRYAARFPVVEINSSFYRPHRRTTYERWAEMTPAGFNFSVKMPKVVTHEHRLGHAMPEVHSFLDACEGLGSKLGCLLIQLPPTLAFDPGVVSRFAEALRVRYRGLVALEPRHHTWFAPQADQLLARHRIARVLSDPVLFASARSPGGWSGFVYLRLHGSPRTYWSAYDAALLDRLADRLALARRQGVTCWCIFDNTAGGAAVANAITLQEALQVNARASVSA